MRTLLLITFLFIVNTVFAKKGIVSISKWKDGDNFPEEISGFHKKSGIKWWLMNDAKNLYIKFEITDKDIQMALMKDGIKFYFDTVKQKNKKDCLIYTNNKKELNQKNKLSFPENGQSDISMVRPFQNENITKKYTQAIWKDMLFNLELEITDFSAYFVLDKNEVLNCYTVIPFKIISNKGLNSIHKLSICFEIESKGQPMPGQGKHPGPPGGSHNGSLPGRPPGGGGNKGMGAPPGMDRTETSASSSFSKTLVKFWFLTKLAYHNE